MPGLNRRGGGDVPTDIAVPQTNQHNDNSSVQTHTTHTSSRSNASRHSQSIVEIRNQEKNSNRMMKDKDVGDIVNTRVDMVIWPKLKYPNLDEGPAARSIKEEIRTAVNLNDDEFEKRWRKLKSQIRTRLRNKRGYAVHQMKKEYFSAWLGWWWSFLHLEPQLLTLPP